jgi:hypothetical protein
MKTLMSFPTSFCTPVRVVFPDVYQMQPNVAYCRACGIALSVILDAGRLVYSFEAETLNNARLEIDVCPLFWVSISCRWSFVSDAASRVPTVVAHGKRALQGTMCDSDSVATSTWSDDVVVTVCNLQRRVTLCMPI